MMKKRIFPLLLCLAFLLTLSIAVSAQEVPDLQKHGTITFLITWEGENLEGGSLCLYRVGTIREDAGNYSFSLIPQLADSGLSLEDPNDPALAQALASYIHSLEGTTVPIREGKAEFADVAPGLYLVVQAEATEGFSPMAPFLISMPRYENGAYVTEVTARPKASLETIPTEPEETRPTEPSEPDLPQTGQLNWPVPVLAVLGLGFFALGWKLRMGESYES